MIATSTPRTSSPNKVKNKRVTEQSLFYWAFSGNFKLQLILLLVIILIVFARVIPLEMQKRIINDAIALRNVEELLLYCGIYIGAVTAASALKLAINSLQATIAERAITTMRKSLYGHILTLPLGFFRTTQPGMVVASLMTELSSAGTFAGMAFAVPVTNILTLLTFAGYLLWLNTPLAAATLVIYPVVVFIIPFLQKRANKANKKRVDVSRKLSSQIAESISGIHEVQVHGAYDQEGSKFDKLAEKLKTIRIRWSLLKFGIKTANNYFVGLGPFIIFIYGGYLVMQGELALGSMVAFLSAQEKLYDPWKELIDFYQTYQDASVRYKRTMQAFDLEPQFLLPPPPAEEKQPAAGSLEVRGLVLDTPEGIRLLAGVSFSLKAGEHLAVVGFSGSGKSTLIQCIGKMFPYSSGSIAVDGEELRDWTKREVIREIGYVSQNPFIFTGTIRENLLYARRAVNGTDNGEEEEQLDLDRLILVLQQSGLFVDVMRFGLDTSIVEDDNITEERVVRIRTRFQEEFGEALADYVEFYENDGYHSTSPVAGNIIFGTSTNPEYSHDLLPENENFRKFLNSRDLFVPLLHLGIDISRQAVDILAGLDTVDLFFQKSPVSADQLDRCSTLLRTLEKTPPEQLAAKDQTFLLSIALHFTPSIHTIARIPSSLKKQILEARAAFPEMSQKVAPDLFIFYDRNRYIHGQSILNNIFFGRIRPGRVRAQELINQAVMQLLIEEDFLEQVAAIGMDHDVGNMGDNLSGGQRQKLAIARVLLKQPHIILMDEATSALDNRSQSRIQRLMSTRWKGRRTVIAVVHRLDIIQDFDKVAVMKAGKIVEFGTYQELIDQEGVLHELIYGRQ